MKVSYERVAPGDIFMILLKFSQYRNEPLLCISIEQVSTTEVRLSFYNQKFGVKAITLNKFQTIKLVSKGVQESLSVG
jgi:intergrase/recombinase